MSDEIERVLLLVDDEENVVSSLVRLFRRDGYRILRATSGQEGLELLVQNKVGVIISDQRMPGMTGSEFLSKVKELYPDTVRIVMSGYTELNSVMDAINRGAIYKFLTKPWEDDLLRDHVQRAFKHYEMERENERLQQELKSANDSLLAMNQQLGVTAEAKTNEVLRTMSLLRISQEILESLPIAVIGIDENGMIAVANRMAHTLFAGENGAPLIGDDVSTRLPEMLLACDSSDNADGSMTGKGTHRLNDGRAVRWWFSPMGKTSGARGSIIMMAELEA